MHAILVPSLRNQVVNVKITYTSAVRVRNSGHFVPHFGLRPGEVLPPKNVNAIWSHGGCRPREFKAGLHLAIEIGWPVLLPGDKLFRLTKIGFTDDTASKEACCPETRAVSITACRGNARRPVTQPLRFPFGNAAAITFGALRTLSRFCLTPFHKPG